MTRVGADRVARFALLAVILPGLVATFYEMWYSLTRSDSNGYGQILLIYGMYGAGVIIWSALRIVLTRALAVLAATPVFAFGFLAIGAAASLGPLALLPWLVAIGGFVASAAAPGRRSQPRQQTSSRPATDSGDDGTPGFDRIHTP